MANGLENETPRLHSRRRVLGWASLALATAACSREPSPAPQTPKPPERSPGFQSGMTLTSWTRGELGSPRGIHALGEIAATGATAVSLIPTGYQNGVNATEISVNPDKTSSDEEIIETISRARGEHGMTVFLKPHVDSINDGEARQDFGQGFNADDRRQWFESYTRFILPYAEMAGKNGVELFSAGCEFKSLSGASEEWGRVTDAIRNVYGGTLTYAAHYDELIDWIAKLDAIGINEYSQVSTEVHPSAQSIADYWKARGDDYIRDVQKFGKPIILTEIGFSSSEGSLINPYTEVSSVPDEDVQAAGYQGVMDMLARPDVREAVHGAYWWNWYPYDFPKPELDTGLSPQGKKAEKVFEVFNRGLRK